LDQSLYLTYDVMEVAADGFFSIVSYIQV